MWPEKFLKKKNCRKRTSTAKHLCCTVRITSLLERNKIFSSKIEQNFKNDACLFLEFNLKLFWPCYLCDKTQNRRTNHCDGSNSCTVSIVFWTLNASIQIETVTLLVHTSRSTLKQLKYKILYIITICI